MTGTMLSNGVDAAAVDNEKYWWHLAVLRESRSRGEAARHAWSLTSAAARIASILAAAPAVGPDARDPVAWSDLSACLGRLAVALDGNVAWIGYADDDPADREAHQAWQRLARTATRSEFAAAWQPVAEGIKALAAPRGDGSPAVLREFTATQVAWAAEAITEAPW